MRVTASSLLKNEPVIYQFGVFTGNSILELNTELKRRGKTIGTCYGFDSFIGLPPELVASEKETDDPGWVEGAISAAAALGTDDPNVAMSRVATKLDRVPNLRLIPGFFEYSLSDPELSKSLQIADYIDIDVDLYSSTFEALDFMFSNKLVKRGTLIGYDDWGGTLVKGKEYECGESRAHKEILEKYCVSFKEIFRSGNPPHVQVMFEVIDFE